MIIKGSLIKLKQVDKKAPRDGIHKKTKRGFVHKLNIMLLDDRLIFIGKDCFYMRLGDNLGIKVFYSIYKKIPKKLDFVQQSIKMSRELFERCLMKESYLLENIELKIDKINCSCWGFRTSHVFVPMEAWVRHYLGYPYKWKAHNHPDHSIEGFKKFANSTKLPSNTSRMCLENVGFDTIDNRWYILDGNINEG